MNCLDGDGCSLSIFTCTISSLFGLNCQTQVTTCVPGLIPDWGTSQSDIFDKSEPIASREQSLMRICHQNRCGARVWAQGLGYTPLSSSRSWVKCEMGELIDPRTMLFSVSWEYEFFYSWACYVTSIKQWTFFWVYLNIHFHNCSQNVYRVPQKNKQKTSRILSLCRCEQYFPSSHIARLPKKTSKALLSTIAVISLCFISVFFHIMYSFSSWVGILGPAWSAWAVRRRWVSAGDGERWLRVATALMLSGSR